MIYITAKQAQKLDRRTTLKFGMPTLLLMENAGREAAQVAYKMLKGRSRVSIFCGPGNNGGDGFVLARHLFYRGIKSEVYLLTGKSKIKDDALKNLEILLKLGFKIKTITDFKRLNRFKDKIKNSDLLIDAIFGIGLTGKIEGLIRTIIEFLNKTKIPILAVDIASGLDATTGEIHGACIKAKKTVTFVFAKKGMVINKGPIYSGNIIVRDIGIIK